jgi:membrane protein required for colicin V production
MNLADYLVIVAIIASAVIGAVRGFLREAIALVTLVFGLYLAWHFAGLIEPHLGGVLSDPPANTWAARTIIFLIVLLIGMALGVVAGYFVRLSIFKGTDRLLGFVFGLVRGVALFGVFVILAQVLRLDGDTWWGRSKLMPYGESIANGLRAIVGEEMLRHVKSISAPAGGT